MDRLEAIYMDPQQRLLLGQSQESMSPLGHKPETSVMIGIGSVEYTALAVHLGNGTYAATGGVAVLASNCILQATLNGTHVYKKVPQPSNCSGTSNAGAPKVTLNSIGPNTLNAKLAVVPSLQPRFSPKPHMNRVSRRSHVRCY